MKIDWFVLFAQTVNFILLLLILKKILFDKIIRIMDERDRSLKSKFSNAEKLQADAKIEIEKYKALNDSIEEEHQQILESIKNDVNIEKDKMLIDAKTELQHQKDKWYHELKQNKETFIMNLGKTISETMFEQSNELFSDLSDDAAARRLIHAFETETLNLPEQRKKEVAAFKGNLSLRSSIDLSPKNREYFELVIKNVFQTNKKVSYMTDRSMKYGFELNADSLQITWTIESYLNRIKKKIENAFHEV
jgi:F-type H+-transporting ATPase subunit b